MEEMEMQGPEFLHPANAEEVANIAEETGAEVVRAALRYRSDSGGWQIPRVARVQGTDPGLRAKAD